MGSFYEIFFIFILLHVFIKQIQGLFQCITLNFFIKIS